MAEGFCEIDVYVANVGDTDVVGGSFYRDIYRRLKNMANIFRNEKYISIGFKHKIVSGGKHIFSAKRPLAEVSGICDVLDYDLCVTGIINYTDAIGQRRETGFFRIVNDANHFVRGDDQGMDYEYED